MERSVKLKSNAKQTFTWLNDWFYRNAVKEDHGSFEASSLASFLDLDSKDFSQREWFINVLKSSMNLSDQEYITLRNAASHDFIDTLYKSLMANASNKGIFSDLLVNEEELIIIVSAQYSFRLSTQYAATPLSNFRTIKIKCYDIGEHRTEVIADVYLDNLSALDALWQEVYSTFEVIEQPQVQAVDSPKPELVGISNAAIQHLREVEYEVVLREIGFEDKTGWDLTLIKMWNDLHSRDEIASRVNVSPDRVTNRISELRRIFGKSGTKILPYDIDRKKRANEKS